MGAERRAGLAAQPHDRAADDPRKRSARRSGSWGAVRQIGTTGHFIEAGVDSAANGAGDAIVTWRGVQALSHGHSTVAVQSSFRPAGGGFGGAQTIREGSQQTTVTGPVVALDDRGTAYAAWSHGAAPVVRLAARSRGARGSWGTARNVGTSPSSQPVIAVTSDRTAIVAWHAAGLDSEGEGCRRARSTSPRACRTAPCLRPSGSPTSRRAPTTS